MNEFLKDCDVPKGNGTLTSGGTVSELFGEFPKAYFYGRNHPTFKFVDDSGKEYLVKLSSALLPAWKSGELTEGMCWNLNVIKLTTTPKGEPLVDTNGNVIPAMLVMTTEQQGSFDPRTLNKEKVAKAVYTPPTSGMFDDLR
jgi:hypothetical protein